MAEFWAKELGLWIVWPIIIVLMIIAPCILWRGCRLSYLTVLCAILIGALGTLWGRNRNAWESVSLASVIHDSAPQIESTIGIGSRADGIILGTTRWINDSFGDGRPPHEIEYKGEYMESGATRYSAYPSRFARWGFQWVNFNQPPRPDGLAPAYVKTVRIPAWFLMGLLGLPIALRVRASIRQRRALRLAMENRCTCGYDLRGTPPNSDGTRRCSECGRTNPPQKVDNPNQFKSSNTTAAPPNEATSNIPAAQTPGASTNPRQPR